MDMSSMSSGAQTGLHVAVASTVGGAIGTLVAWVLTLHGITPPPEAAEAITVLSGTGVSVISSLVMNKLGVLPT
jgi:hypothetical protein